MALMCKKKEVLATAEGDPDVSRWILASKIVILPDEDEKNVSIHGASTVH